MHPDSEKRDYDGPNYGSTSTRQLDEASESSPKADTDTRDDRKGSSGNLSSQIHKSVLFQSCVQCQSPCCKKRYLTAVMCCIGFIIIMGFRCNVAVATSYFRNSSSSCLPSRENTTNNRISVCQWSVGAIGAVEGCYFVGHLITQFPAGLIASKFSPTVVFSVAILASSLLNLLLPLAFNVGFILAAALRFLQGLFDGCCGPASHGIWRYWAPPLDRSRLVSLSFGGLYAGVFLGLLLSGVLADRLGWQAPFYFYGGAGVFWFGMWQIFVYEKPSTHPCISDEEREYIEESIGENMDVHDKICNLPWRNFFTSMPVYAIIVANFNRNWSFYLLMTQPVKYFCDVFNYSLSKSGYFSSLPYLLMAIVVPIGGQLADELRTKGLSTTVVRKLFNCIGFGLEAVFLLGAGYSTSGTAAVVCLTVGVSFGGLAISGFNVNHLDIAPRYASILMGLSNGIGSISGILVPIVTGIIVQDHKPQSWSWVFLTAALVHFVGVIFYAIFASGSKQDWAKDKDEDEDEDEEPLKLQTLGSPRRRHDDENCASKLDEASLFPTVPISVQQQRQ